MAIWNEKDPPAVGKKYTFETGEFVFRGGDPQDNTNWAKADSWTATGAKIKGAFTAEGRHDPTIGEIGAAPEVGGLRSLGKGGFKASAGLLATGGHGEVGKNIIKNNIPDAQFKEDKYGNTTVVIGGKEYYINKPGWSTQDTLTAVGTILSFMGIGRGLKLGAPGSGIGKNILKAGATGGLLSAGQDLISTLTGGEQKGTLSSLGLVDRDLGISLPKAVGTGLATAAFQGAGDVIFSAIPSLAAALKNTQIKLGAADDSIFSSTGTLTAQGQQILKQLGVEWKTMTKEFKDRLRNEFIKPGDLKPKPEEAVAYAEAQSLPVPVPQTRGTLSGRPIDQLREDLARKGVYGEQAEKIITQARIAQQQAIDQNRAAIAEKIAGGSPVIAKGQSGEIVQAEIKAGRDKAGREANQAYKDARDLAAQEGSILPAGVFSGFSQRVRDLVSRDHALTMGGKPNKELALVDSYLKQLALFEAKGTNVPIKEIFDYRSSITGRIGQGKGDSVSAALKVIKKELDKKINVLLDTALEKGNSAVIEAWRSAIKGWKDYKSTWESGNLMDRLTQVNPKNTAIVEFKVSPESASNYIFNSSNLGFLSKANLQRDLLKMKKHLTPEAWGSLRQEIYLKIVNASLNPQGTGISGAALLKNVNKTLRENQPLMSALYSSEEQALLSQFARVANRTLNTQINASNTASATLNALKDLFRNLVVVLGIKDLKPWLAALPFLSKGTKGIREGYQASQIKSAIDAQPGVVVQPLGPVPGSVGAGTVDLIRQLNTPTAPPY